MSDSLQPHVLQHTRPSLSLQVCSNSCPLSQWCYLSNHLNLCCPLLLLSSIFPSIRVFSNESALHIRWPKYWSFSFSISPSNEYSGLISFRIDWFDLLAVQGTLKSLLQHHNLKASILQHSAFFMVQFSHTYMTTGKTIALTIQTFVSKVMSLIFNMLSRFITAFFKGASSCSLLKVIEWQLPKKKYWNQLVTSLLISLLHPGSFVCQWAYQNIDLNHSWTIWELSCQNYSTLSEPIPERPLKTSGKINGNQPKRWLLNESAGSLLNQLKKTKLLVERDHLCVHVKSLQLCLSLCDPLDCSLPGSSVHGILQARILELLATPAAQFQKNKWPNQKMD